MKIPLMPLLISFFLLNSANNTFAQLFVNNEHAAGLIAENFIKELNGFNFSDSPKIYVFTPEPTGQYVDEKFASELQKFIVNKKSNVFELVNCAHTPDADTNNTDIVYDPDYKDCVKKSNSDYLKISYRIDKDSISVDFNFGFPSGRKSIYDKNLKTHNYNCDYFSNIDGSLSEVLLKYSELDKSNPFYSVDINNIFLNGSIGWFSDSIKEHIYKVNSGNIIKLLPSYEDPQQANATKIIIKCKYSYNSDYAIIYFTLEPKSYCLSYLVSMQAIRELHPVSVNITSNEDFYKQETYPLKSEIQNYLKNNYICIKDKNEKPDWQVKIEITKNTVTNNNGLYIVGVVGHVILSNAVKSLENSIAFSFAGSDFSKDYAIEKAFKDDDNYGEGIINIVDMLLKNINEEN